MSHTGEVLKNESVKKAITIEVGQVVPSLVKTEIEKQQTLLKNEALRYRNIQWINSNKNPDQKPLSAIPFSYLRRIAISYPIARACINRRIRQITQLGWDINTVDDIEGENPFKAKIAELKIFFRNPMGPKTRLREMLSIMVDDVLTIDATCFEMQKTRGGDFLHLIPVDPTTIALKVTETGATPFPPDPAYVQIISGQVINEFTTDEMIYEAMNTRSYTPYGLAPLESLLLQVESALRGALYNLNYFKESNVPEGFITLPDEVATSKEMVEQWQLWFDAMVAGDPRFQRRLKILPGGSEYTAAKKPEDMAFERFELWLLQQTCAVFDVPPQDIGITYQVNKATGENQSDLSRERGLIPLANFVKEILDDIIQIELGNPYLQWVWTNINPKDRKEEVEIAEKEMNMGALSVDEYREEQGRKPLGLKHYIRTGNTITMVDDVVTGKYVERQDMALQNKNTLKDPKKSGDSEADNTDASVEDTKKFEIEDLRRWKKCILKDLEMGRPLRTKFPSKFISSDLHITIEKGLSEVHSKDQAKALFEEYLNPEVRSAFTILKVAEEMRRIENATIKEPKA